MEEPHLGGGSEQPSDASQVGRRIVPLSDTAALGEHEHWLAHLGETAREAGVILLGEVLVVVLWVGAMWVMYWCLEALWARYPATLTMWVVDVIKWGGQIVLTAFVLMHVCRQLYSMGKKFVHFFRDEFRGWQSGRAA